MKKILILLLVIFPKLCIAQSSYSVTLKESFVYHQMDVLDKQTQNTLSSFDDIRGIIVHTVIDGKEYILITTGESTTYQLTIVNKVVDNYDKNIKTIMYQGGEKKEGMGVYVANVFFCYDLSKNKEIPELIRVDLHGSPYFMDYSGIIKLND